MDGLSKETEYQIGVIGDEPSLRAFWEMFTQPGGDNVLKGIGLRAAALPGEVEFPADMDWGIGVKAYCGYKKMLEAHPEINMVIETTGRPPLVEELRRELPSRISLVERAAARFFIRLLTSEKMWVACKLDLLHAQSMLRVIIDQLEDEIVFMDREGRILDMNKAVVKRLDRPKSQIRGESFCDLYTTNAVSDNGEAACPLDKVLASGEPADFSYSSLTEDGRVNYFRLYVYPIFDEDGSLNHLIGMRRDITHRTQIELRLQQAEKLASIGELSTYVAHEIRNPLFTISGFANSLMRMEGLDKKAQDKLSIILDESRRLDEILKSLMNFTRPTEAAVTTVNLNEVVRATMDVMSYPCGNKEIEVVIDLDEGLAKVNANPDLIKQCLINLVKNSIEATAKGGRLIISTGMIRDKVALTVEDTGEGIPPEIHDKVFSPFFSTRGKGSGLGLAMTKKIMDEIGGSVDLVSRVGVGTKVTLFLPPVLAVAENVAKG